MPNVISGNQLSVIGVLNRFDKNVGPALISFQADFTGANNEVVIEPVLQQQGLTFSLVKTLFFDNSGNSNPVEVEVTNTNQTFDIPPLSNGFYVIAAQNNSKIIMRSVGGATEIARGQLFNWDIPPCVWYGFGQPVTVAGTVPVSAVDGAIVNLGLKADAAIVDPTVPATLTALLKGIMTVLENPIVQGSTAVSNSSGNVANAAAVATLAADPARTNYVETITITGAGSTAGLGVTATLAGVIGGPLSFTFMAPVGVLVPGNPIVATFDPPLPCTGVNIAAVLTLPALGAGNTHASVSIAGFKK